MDTEFFKLLLFNLLIETVLTGTDFPNFSKQFFEVVMSERRTLFQTFLVKY